MQPLRLSRMLERASTARLLLVLFCLVCFLPGIFTTPVVDRDEARFAQASRQMVETGDFVDPQLGTEARYQKPIGIYWLQSAAVLVSGQGTEASIWVYRLVSFAGALIAVLLTFEIGRRMANAETGLFAALLLGASLILAVEARLAKTDAMLLATIVAAQLALWRLWSHGEEKRRFLGWPLFFWVALGIGILVKGPIGPMVSGLTIAALALWDRRLGWLTRLRPLPGLALTAVIVLPWLLAIHIASDGAFFGVSLGRDMFAKLGTGQETHGAPFGTHAVLFWLAFWPGALLLAAAAPAIWRSRKEPATRFLLSWALPTFLVFELAATKLVHYTLPTFPAFALLAALAFASATGPLRLWQELLLALAGIIGIALAIGGNVLLHALEGTTSPIAITLTFAVAAAALFAAVASVRNRHRAALLALVAQAALVYATLFGSIPPSLHSVWIAPRLADTVARLAACEAPEVVASGYGEASLLFALDSRVLFVSGEAAAEFLAAPACRVAIVAGESIAPFEAALPAGMDIRAERFSGINLGNMRRLDFLVATTVEARP